MNTTSFFKKRVQSDPSSNAAGEEKIPPPLTKPKALPVAAAAVTKAKTASAPSPPLPASLSTPSKVQRVRDIGEMLKSGSAGGGAAAASSSSRQPNSSLSSYASLQNQNGNAGGGSGAVEEEDEEAEEKGEGAEQEKMNGAAATAVAGRFVKGNAWATGSQISPPALKKKYVIVADEFLQKKENSHDDDDDDDDDDTEEHDSSSCCDDHHDQREGGAFHHHHHHDDDTDDSAADDEDEEVKEARSASQGAVAFLVVIQSLGIVYMLLCGIATFIMQTGGTPVGSSGGGGGGDGTRYFVLFYPPHSFSSSSLSSSSSSSSLNDAKGSEGGGVPSFEASSQSYADSAFRLFLYFFSLTTSVSSNRRLEPFYLLPSFSTSSSSLSSVASAPSFNFIPAHAIVLLLVLCVLWNACHWYAWGSSPGFARGGWEMVVTEEARRRLEAAASSSASSLLLSASAAVTAGKGEGIQGEEQNDRRREIECTPKDVTTAVAVGESATVNTSATAMKAELKASAVGTPSVTAMKSEPALMTKVEELPRLRWCDDCSLYQPLRTKHCDKCGACVRKYDHHCFWVGTCVGEKNHFRFMLLLFAGTGFIFTGTVFFFHYFVFWRNLSWHCNSGGGGGGGGVLSSSVSSSSSSSPSSLCPPAPWAFNNPTFYNLLANAFPLFIVLIGLGMLIFVVVLLGLHLYLVVTNQTTWEVSSAEKISYLRDRSKRGGGVNDNEDDDHRGGNNNSSHYSSSSSSSRRKKMIVLLEQPFDAVTTLIKGLRGARKDFFTRIQKMKMMRRGFNHSIIAMMGQTNGASEDAMTASAPSFSFTTTSSSSISPALYPLLAVLGFLHNLIILAFAAGLDEKFIDWAERHDLIAKEKEQNQRTRKREALLRRQRQKERRRQSFGDAIARLVLKLCFSIDIPSSVPRPQKTSRPRNERHQCFQVIRERAVLIKSFAFRVSLLIVVPFLNVASLLISNVIAYGLVLGPIYILSWIYFCCLLRILAMCCDGVCRSKCLCFTVLSSSSSSRRKGRRWEEVLGEEGSAEVEDNDPSPRSSAKPNASAFFVPFSKFPQFSVFVSHWRAMIAFYNGRFPSPGLLCEDDKREWAALASVNGGGASATTTTTTSSRAVVTIHRGEPPDGASSSMASEVPISPHHHHPPAAEMQHHQQSLPWRLIRRGVRSGHENIGEVGDGGGGPQNNASTIVVAIEWLIR